MVRVNEEPHQAMLVYCDESKSQPKFWHYLQHIVATWQKKIQSHNLKNLVKSQLPCQACCRNDLLKPDVVIVMLHENWSDYWWRMLFQCCQYFVISDGEGLMYPSQIRHIPYHRDQKENKPISSVQSLSHVWLFATPWIAACQASLSITISQSSLRLTFIESVMPSSHLILCRPLLLLPPIPPSIRVFSNESTLHMRWPKYWSFSFSIIPSKEIPGLIMPKCPKISLHH